MTVEQAAVEILESCEVPKHLRGFKYLVSAITEGYKNPSITELLTKDLYPKIGKMHHTNARCVERSMRFAVAKSNMKHHITTGQFVHTAIWKLRTMKTPPTW